VAWLSRVTWINSEKPQGVDINNIGNDIRTWGDDVNANSKKLSNLAELHGASNIIKFFTNAVEAARFDANRKLGILTTSPNGRLTLGSEADDVSLSGTGNTQGLHFYARQFGNCMIDALVSGASSSALTLRNYNNGTYHTLLHGDANGRVCVGGASGGVSGTGKFQHIGNTIRLIDNARTPASSADTGNAGEYCIDTGFIYVHSGGSWRRAAIATF